MHSTASLWHSASSLPRFSGLGSEVRADVAIVGGGVTGLTTALLLAEAGKSVVLLEGRQLGAGVTGSTTAHLTEALDTRYHELESKFGREGAQLARASSREAIELIARLASGTNCGFERVDGYLFAERREQLAELDAELSAAERAGASVERSEVPLPFAIQAGLCFRDQAQILPLLYLRVLAERLTKTTARVFEGVTMLDLEATDPFRIVTDAGYAVVADAVVLATHAPFAKLTLQLKLTQYRSYALAGAVAAAPPGLFWDLADPYHYIRSARINGKTYAILGGEDHRTGETPENGYDEPYQQLRAYAARLGVSAEARWSAQVVESADGLPFIGKPSSDQNLYLATGFAGNGMTFGTLSASIITDAILGRENRFAELYRVNRLGPIAALGTIVAENVDTAVHLVKDHVKPVSHEPLSELPLGTGRIVKRDGERLAVYRDHDGVLHALSPVCTHMGCQVAFNPVERSWDCPCHGSRYGIDGRVLDGPATKPLEKRPRE